MKPATVTLIATAAMFTLGTVFWFALIPREIRESDAARSERIRTADDAASVIASFGRPDADTTTTTPEGEATRVLSYPRLHIVFVRRTSPASPSAPLWKLVGFLDPGSRESLPGTEALRRLQARH